MLESVLQRHSRRRQIEQELIDRVSTGRAAREDLLSQPRAVLERELGITLPVDVSIRIHEDTAQVIHLVVPALDEEARPLTPAELEVVAGGKKAMTAHPKKM
jgi:hypothetical protein